jgi:hypothetical protein
MSFEFPAGDTGFHLSAGRFGPAKMPGIGSWTKTLSEIAGAGFARLNAKPA